jgi:hypothetical protein
MLVARAGGWFAIVPVQLGGEVEFVDYPTMRELNSRANELDFWVNCRASSQRPAMGPDGSLAAWTSCCDNP